MAQGPDHRHESLRPRRQGRLHRRRAPRHGHLRSAVGEFEIFRSRAQCDALRRRPCRSISTTTPFASATARTSPPSPPFADDGHAACRLRSGARQGGHRRPRLLRLRRPRRGNAMASRSSACDPRPPLIPAQAADPACEGRNLASGTASARIALLAVATPETLGPRLRGDERQVAAASLTTSAGSRA